MKFFVSIIVTAILAFSMGYVLPWWSIAVTGFISGVFFIQSKLLSFLSAFIAVALFWGIMALYISNANNHILAHRISLLIIKKDNPYLLILLTSLIGGLTTGVSALTGRSLVLIIKKV